MAVHVSRAEFGSRASGAGTLPTISCPECGVPTIARDDGFLCLDCVRATYDWRAPLEAHLKKHPKLLTVRRCTGCERVETTAANKKERRWERGDRDTDELLAVLVKARQGAALREEGPGSGGRFVRGFESWRPARAAGRVSSGRSRTRGA